MHGTADPKAKVEEGHGVYAAVPGNKEFRLFESAGHESYVALNPEAWRAAVGKILETAAGPRK